MKAAREAVARGQSNKLQRELAKFPYEIKEDGSCSKLGEDGKCTVYNKRPDVCSVEKSFKKFAPSGTSKRLYYSINGAACNKMIKANGLDKKFLVKEIY